MEIRLQSAGRRGIERELLVGFIEAYSDAQSKGVIQPRTTEVLLSELYELSRFALSLLDAPEFDIDDRGDIHDLIPLQLHGKRVRMVAIDA